jgi:hypothetical protein
MERLFQVRACNHHFLTARVKRSLNNIGQIVFMRLLPVVFPLKHRVSEVDADLHLLAREHLEHRFLTRTSAYLRDFMLAVMVAKVDLLSLRTVTHLSQSHFRVHIALYTEA